MCLLKKKTDSIDDWIVWRINIEMSLFHVIYY